MDIRFVYFLAVLGFIQCKLINLKCNGIKTFIKGHNVRRHQVLQGKVPGQPGASKMNYMIWDDELAEKAAKWASRNKYGHNPDNSIPSNRFTTGENIHMFSTSDQNFNNFDIDTAMASWFKEHKNFHYKQLESTDFSSDSPVFGHYTQLVWSNSVYLGCAVSRFKNDAWINFFVVCNYGPPGNYMNQAPYESGQASGEMTCGAKNCSRLYGGSC